MFSLQYLYPVTICSFFVDIDIKTTFKEILVKVNTCKMKSIKLGCTIFLGQHVKRSLSGIFYSVMS